MGSPMNRLALLVKLIYWETVRELFAVFLSLLTRLGSVVSLLEDRESRLGSLDSRNLRELTTFSLIAMFLSSASILFLIFSSLISDISLLFCASMDIAMSLTCSISKNISVKFSRVRLFCWLIFYFISFFKTSSFLSMC